MPRNGQGVYSLPPVYEAVTGETIEAPQHNTPLEDIAADLNQPRSVATGGTGGASATQARENLDIYSKSESVQAALDAISNFSTKVTIVDADSIAIVDSEDENKPKRVLWSGIKSALKTYFDTLYAVIGEYLPLVGGIVTGPLSVHFAGTGSKFLWGASTSNRSALSVDANGSGLVSLYGADGTSYLSGDGANLLRGLTYEISRGTLAIRSSGTGQKLYWGSVGSDSFLAIDANGSGQVGLYGANGSSYISADGVNLLRGSSYEISRGTLTVSQRISSNADIRAATYVYVGSAYMASDGNINGSKWSAWGNAFAFEAINARIEARGPALAQSWSAGRSAGDVGTYAFLKKGSGGAGGAPWNEIRSGNDLSPDSNTATGTGGAWLGYGSWRSMGSCINGNATLFLRIS